MFETNLCNLKLRTLHRSIASLCYGEMGDSHIAGYADMHTSTCTKYDNKLVCNIENNNNNYKY